METNIVIELIVLGTIIVIGFLAIKLGLEQDENKNLKIWIKSLENQKAMILKDYGSLYGKYLNARKQLKSANVVCTSQCKSPKQLKKDVNQSINEMNKHSDKRVIDSLEDEMGKE
jgi:F420-0:gamma-glutamyl ligase-like protein